MEFHVWRVRENKLVFFSRLSDPSADGIFLPAKIIRFVAIVTPTGGNCQARSFSNNCLLAVEY